MPDKVEEKVVAEEHAPASARGLVEMVPSPAQGGAVAAEAASECAAAEAGATATAPEQQAVQC